MLIRGVSFTVIILFMIKVSAQEVVSELTFNSKLYQKFQQQKVSARKTVSGDYIYVSDTLTVPFLDDFSVNLLRRNLPPGQVLDTINRSMELGATVDSFIHSEKAWYYSYNIGTSSVDSTLKPFIGPVLILNDNCDNLFLPTDTLSYWPNYYRYEFNLNTGAKLDSTLVELDTLIKEFTVFQVVKDQDVKALWLDNQVYINNTYPVNPESFGVATFDGLDETGLPYDYRGTSLAPRSADTLTSKPIDLSGYDANSNLYLSFFYQPQGLGDYPNIGDSLVLEFRSICDNWDKVWGAEGFEALLQAPPFKQVFIHINNPFYFNNAFQFRFRNKASIIGNNDHWHLDYVYINDLRSEADTTIRDISVLNPPGTFLRNYSSMPWDHFKDNVSSESLETFEYTLRNHHSAANNTGSAYSFYEIYTNTLLSDTTFIFFNFAAQDDRTFIYQPVTLLSKLPALVPPNDSVSINATAFLDKSGLLGFLNPNNDSLSTRIDFFNYFAYDDGSAEKAYGLEGTGLKKFAYEFNLNKPDTLRGIYIHFTNIIEDVSILYEITLSVWNEIGFSGMQEDTLYAKPSIKIFNGLGRDNFATYVLDSPLVIEGKFYIGWQQLFEENIQVGLDLNNTATEHMYFYTNGNWKQSGIAGAPMIRPIVGKKIPLIGTAIHESRQVKKEVFIYPNPVNDYIYIRSESQGIAYDVEIFDLSGKLIYSARNTERKINVSGLIDGLYILKLSSPVEQISQAHRFIKM